jgi:hypothetical protein
MKAAHKTNKIAWIVGDVMDFPDELRGTASGVIGALDLHDVNTIDDIGSRGDRLAMME